MLLPKHLLAKTDYYLVKLFVHESRHYRSEFYDIVIVYLRRRTLLSLFLRQKKLTFKFKRSYHPDEQGNDWYRSASEYNELNKQLREWVVRQPERPVSKIQLLGLRLRSIFTLSKTKRRKLRLQANDAGFMMEWSSDKTHEETNENIRLRQIEEK